MIIVGNVKDGIDRTSYEWLLALPDEMLKWLDDARGLRNLEDAVRDRHVVKVGEDLKKLETVLASYTEQLNKKQRLLIELRTKKFATVEDIKRVERQLQVERELLDKHRGNLATMRKSLFQVDIEVRNELETLEEKLRLTRQLHGLAALASGVSALGAIRLSLHKSIWARGEKTIGKSAWNQIFADDQDFANAMQVENLSDIIESIAQLFGQYVNHKALQL